MKKYCVLLLVAILTVAAVYGCTPQPYGPESIPEESASLPKESLFEMETDPGSLGHGPASPDRDETGARLPFHYEGGEMRLEYEVHATGMAKNVGFLVFVDGIAQPYRLDETDTSCQYMHIFDLEEDAKSYPFSFVFTPVTGKKGDTLALTVVSVYGPSFMPDMEETSGYRGYQTTLEGFYELYFEADADLPDNSAVPRHRCLEIEQSTEPITQEYLDILSDIEKPVTLETLNEQIVVELMFDGQRKYISSYAIEADGTLYVTFKITGRPGARYRHTFYIDHQALTDEGKVSFETVLTYGNISVIEAKIDLAKREDSGTFYVVSALCDIQAIQENCYPLLKTSSVLLYKK